MSNLLVDSIIHNPDIAHKCAERLASPQVLCEKPQFIIHPSLGYLLCRFHRYVMAGHEFYYKYNYRGLTSLDKSIFYEALKCITHDNCKDFYVVDEHTGEIYNIYLEVPCGHCDLCQQRKANAFVSRCRMESQLYDCNPYFFTLTYDNNHLPDEGVSVSDIQKFMKRFRRRLECHGFFEKIRYCICSEYGPKTHRAHYHGIIWNLKPNVVCNLTALQSIMQKSWSNGEVRRPRFVDPSSDKCFYYTTKYMCKGSSAPSGKNNVFMLSSRGKGGIGAKFIDSLQKDFRRYLSTDFSYVDKFTGKKTPLILSHYVLDRLLPSFCRSVPSQLRVGVRQFMQLYKDACYRDEFVAKMLYETTYEKIKSHYQGAFYFGEISPKEHYVNNLSDGQLFGKLRELQRSIGRYFDKTIDFAQAKKIQAKRNNFLSRFCFLPDGSDITDRMYRASQSRGRLLAHSVL